MVGEKFFFDIDNSKNRYYSIIYYYYYFVYTSAYNLVAVVFVCDCRKVDVCACEDEIKVNYFRLIRSQREPYINYAERAREI